MAKVYMRYAIRHNKLCIRFVDKWCTEHKIERVSDERLAWCIDTAIKYLSPVLMLYEMKAALIPKKEWETISFDEPPFEGKKRLDPSKRPLKLGTAEQNHWWRGLCAMRAEQARREEHGLRDT